MSHKDQDHTPVTAMVTLAAALVLGVSARPAAAVIGEAPMSTSRPPAGLGLTDNGASVASDLLLAPQLRSKIRDDGQSGLQLTGADGLLGTYGLTAAGVLERLAPHLTGCSLRLRDVQAADRTVHEFYDLYYGPWRLVGAWLHLHHTDNALAAVRARLPDYRLPPAPPQPEDFLPLADLGYGSTGEATASRTAQVIAESGGLPAPAWEVTTIDRQGMVETRQVIDAQTGALLLEKTTAYDLASVYAVSPADGRLIPVELAGLRDSGHLDGAAVSVYAPTAADPRAAATGAHFQFDPDDPREALDFDQVQAYYNANRALNWFEERLGVAPPPAPMTVRVNDDFGTTVDDARYLPPPFGPEIRIGKGARLRNLARDSDVLNHELAHHVIWRNLPSRAGEAGMLHEGTADYFAYAINGDPNLAESVRPGAPWLRTAALPPEETWESLDQPAGPHAGGQVWSALLWDLRQTLGPATDRLVHAGLAYLGPESGFGDALVGLLAADRDLHPRAVDSGTAAVAGFGANQCAILSAALTRGFASYLEQVDGEACGLDLARLASESRERLAGRDKSGGRGKGFSVSAFGRTCAVVGGTRGSRLPAGLLLLMAPLLALCAPRRRLNSGSPSMGESRDGA